MNRRMMWEEAEAGRGPYPDEDHDGLCGNTAPAEDTGASRRADADGHWPITRSVAERLLRAARYRGRGERADVRLQLRYAAGDRAEAHRRGCGVPR